MGGLNSVPPHAHMVGSTTHSVDLLIWAGGKSVYLPIWGCGVELEAPYKHVAYPCILGKRRVALADSQSHSDVPERPSVQYG